jgi:CheY-like chemotaxis protein
MKILVVDHHVLIREALRGVLKELRGDITALEAADSREAMPLIDENADLDFLLLDLNLPDRDGFSVLSELRMSHPAISVVVMSAQQDHDSVKKALNQGALGFPKALQTKTRQSCRPPLPPFTVETAALKFRNRPPARSFSGRCSSSFRVASTFRLRPFPTRFCPPISARFCPPTSN